MENFTVDGITSMVVSSNGHTLFRLKHCSASEREKFKLMKSRGCPVNKKIPTKMTRDAFVRMCTAFQKMAGIIKENNPNKDQKGKAVRSTAHGFRTNNQKVCTDCEIGEAVRNKQNFKPPINLTFVKL